MTQIIIHSQASGGISNTGPSPSGAASDMPPQSNATIDNQSSLEQGWS